NDLQVSVDLLFRTTDRNLYVIAIADWNAQRIDHAAGDFHEAIACRANRRTDRRRQIDAGVEVRIAEPWWLEWRRCRTETLCHYGPNNRAGHGSRHAAGVTRNN